MSKTVEEFIQHHGVKGMRWGVRRSRRSRASSDKESSRAKSRTVFKKSPKNLTTTELDRRIRRMEMEKRYNELNKRDVSNGERIAVEVLTNVGRQTATNVGTRLATNLTLLGLEKGIEKAAGGEVAKILVKGKKKS